LIRASPFWRWPDNIAVAICPVCREQYLGDESFCPRDGAALTAAPEDPLLGATLGGRYLVEARIGEGGMGTVYRGRHTVMERPVAIKLLRRDLAGDEAAVRRFQREARAASALDHPHCTRVLDFGQTNDGLLYLVMELLEGESLGQVLLRGPLAAARALIVVRQVALALAHAHERGLVHRDLKPDNIYLCPGGRVKVLDFGLCKQVSEIEPGLTQAGVVFGTPEYMSPEQAEGKPIDGRSDLYSLGAVLFRTLTGELPFQASTYLGLLTQHISATPPVPSHVRPDLAIQPAVDELVLQLLEKLPARRPASAGALVVAIDAIVQPGGSARVAAELGPGATSRR
jgi:serine/threonine-protein kinase